VSANYLTDWTGQSGINQPITAGERSLSANHPVLKGPNRPITPDSERFLSANHLNQGAADQSINKSINRSSINRRIPVGQSHVVLRGPSRPITSINQSTNQPIPPGSAGTQIGEVAECGGGVSPREVSWRLNQSIDQSASHTWFCGDP
jgi:hypothetical protein